MAEIPGISILKDFLNSSFKDKEPWQIVTITTTTVLATVWLWEYCFQDDESLVQRGKKKMFKLARLVPSIRKKIETELAAINDNFEKEAAQRLNGMECFPQLPKTGLSKDKVLELVNQFVNLGNYDWESGKVSGTVYRLDKDLVDLVTSVYGIASYTNPLHVDVFPGICKMEAEVVKASCHLFNGGPESCGTMSTGGTESILLACKALRDYAREHKGIKHPEMVVPTTAHSAFDKAAQFLKIKVISAPVNPNSFTVSIKAMTSAISRNTIMLVGSAPNFPYGTMDNIEEISKLGVQYDIPVHVDACLGGFLICFMRAAGFELPPFDFQLPGVVSISADTHKYGYAPKGSSVILYRERKYRHHQYTVTTDWPGGIYGSPTVNGSRAGGIIAACWATLMFFGQDGYVQATKSIIEVSRYIEQELRKMHGIFVFGTPATSVIAIGSQDFHIYRLSDALGAKGWNLNTLQFPSGIHICVTHLHTKTGVADEFLNDVREELTKLMEVREAPVEGKLAMYGMSQSIPDRSVVGDFTRFFLDSMYYIPQAEEYTETNGKAILPR